jgi:hypothetical protein
MKVTITAKPLSSGVLRIEFDGIEILRAKRIRSGCDFEISRIDGGGMLATGASYPESVSGLEKSGEVLCRLAFVETEGVVNPKTCDMVKCGKDLRILENGELLSSSRLGDRNSRFPEVGIQSSGFSWSGKFDASVVVNEDEGDHRLVRAVAILTYLCYSNSAT